MRLGFIMAPFFAVSLATRACSEHTDLDGRALFLGHCAECHGAEGRGDGPSASALPTEPADLTQIAARRSGVWPVLEIMSIIDGYAELNDLRGNMPIIEEVVEGPIIEFDAGNGILVPTPARLVALAEYLERIQTPQPERYVP
jgi:mono/diheme cytochrome c family protein